MESFADREVRVGDLDLHYTEWNPAGERVLVMLHGLNVQAHTWDPIAVELAAEHRVICPDLRGHGLSGWAADGYRLERFVEDLDGFADALGLERFDLVGHSLGCRVGIGFAAARPAAVGRMVLSDAGPEFPAAAKEFTDRIVGTAGGAVRGFRTEADALEYYRRMHPEWQDAFHRLHVEYQLKRNWAGRLVFRADPELYWMTEVGEEDDAYVWEKLDGLQTPTLILWGRRSPFLDEAIVERMLELMEAGSLERTDSGHYIPREAPQEFLTRVRRFLAR